MPSASRREELVVILMEHHLTRVWENRKCTKLGWQNEKHLNKISQGYGILIKNTVRECLEGLEDS